MRKKCRVRVGDSRNMPAALLYNLGHAHTNMQSPGLNGEGTKSRYMRLSDLWVSQSPVSFAVARSISRQSDAFPGSHNTNDSKSCSVAVTNAWPMLP